LHLCHDRRILNSTMNSQTAQITIRPGYADDYDALARLAALDSSPAVPPRPVLLVEVDGALRAALSLRDGSCIADPFFPTAGLLVLLRAHAEGEGESERRVVRRPRWRRGSRRRPAYARG
jgi:hypothetical protein